MTETPWPTVAAASKNPNGSPVRMCSGSISKVSAAGHRHADQPRAFATAPQADGAARQRARQRRRVVDLEPDLGDAAPVTQGVGDPQLVADVAVELAHRIACLEVRQAHPHEDVTPADHQDRQVQQVEQEREPGRERGDDEDRRDNEDLQAADHAIRPPGSRLVAWPIPYAPRCAEVSAGARNSVDRPARRAGCHPRRPSRAARGRPDRPARRGSTSWS